MSLFSAIPQRASETYDYLKKVENYLGEEIIYLDATTTLPKGVKKIICLIFY